jgi:hypothetical protein
MPKIPTNEEFDYRLKKTHGDKFVRVEERIPNQKKIKCLCKECGNVWEPQVRHILNGSGCPNCRKTSKEEFDKKVQELFEKDYYRVSEYPGSQTKKVTMLCNVCGSTNDQKVSHILSGHGCKICGHERVIEKQRITKEELIIRSKQINGNIYDFDLVTYSQLTTKDKIPIICKKHGTFHQTIQNHIYGKCGCPKCKESKGEKKIRLYLESVDVNYVKNKTFQGCRYKRKLPFDFYLPEYNTLIEYDGEQHFHRIRFGFGKYMTDEEKDMYLETIQKRDAIKDGYCNKNNIRLIRISYKQYNDIESILSSLF